MGVHGSAAVVQIYIPYRSPVLEVDRVTPEHHRFIAKSCHELAHDVHRLRSTQHQQQLSIIKHDNYTIATSAATSASTLAMGATNSTNKRNQRQHATVAQLHLCKGVFTTPLQFLWGYNAHASTVYAQFLKLRRVSLCSIYPMGCWACLNGCLVMF